jgi:hypothetical protein
MKKILTSLLLCVGSILSHAQMMLTYNSTAQQLTNALVATSGTLGVTVSNPSLVCGDSSWAEFSGPTNLGMNQGIVLAAGSLVGTGPNNAGLIGIPSDFAVGSDTLAGDADLSVLANCNTRGACILEFDLQPAGSFVEFEYIFGSEEYPEFNCTSFNDIFAFIISGPGFTTPTNIALLPGTTTPVSVNSVNDQSSGCGDSTYYVANIDSFLTVDGFTTPLIAYANVTAGQTYHLKLGVADAIDNIVNSFVFLKSNSLKSGNTTPSSLNHQASLNKVVMYPSEVDDVLQLKHIANQNMLVQIVNVQGQVVFRKQLQTNDNISSINLSSLQSGVYIVQLLHENGEKRNEKIIKR